MEVAEDEALTSAIVVARSRLKREECKRTKHDSAFSPWKVLIGPSDWEDHATGKEGAERYRTQNLPNCTSCTGVYELGIAIGHHQAGRDSNKLNPNFIIPVYLGKADNVRNRMRQYGREGAHLENGNSNGRFSDSDKILVQTGPGLFREIFSKGLAIVYRWAPVENTRDAEKTESDLLDKFDYAWNKGSNGIRRPNDILKKLESISKTPFLAKLQIFPQKRKGIKIKVYKLPSMENGLDFYSNLEANGFLHQIFKFGRSQPRLVVRSGVDENYSSICGVALGHGVICKRSPTEGNKRCAEHKGMKVNGFTPKLLTDGKATSIVDEHPNIKDSTPVCGVILDDGSSCKSKPLQGNKRCLEHKGRKICSSIPQQTKDKQVDYVYPSVHVSPGKVAKHRNESGDTSVICGVDLDDRTFCTRQPPVGRKRCEQHKGMRIKETTSSSFREEIPSVFCEKSSPTCGAALHNGSFCSRKPTEGNKRCWQHESTTRVVANPGSSSIGDFKHRDFSSQYYSYGSSVHEHTSPSCGAAIQNGSFCSRKPTEGNKRCWQHESTTRVVANPRSSSIGDFKHRDFSSQYSSYGSSVHEHTSPSCGAALQNGSFCSRKPTEGNKRCWQHYGMKVNSNPGSCNNKKIYGPSSQYALFHTAHGKISYACGAPLRNGGSCSRRVTGGRCWQHGG